MSWNGSGVFTRLYNWVTDAASAIPITPSRMDNDTNDIVTGLNNCLTRDGQGKPSDNLSMNGFKLTGMAAATVAGDAVRYEQLQSAIPSGTLLDFAGTAAPSGFVLCDGSAISRATYAALFVAIGTAWGAGDGSTTFNVPDLRRKTTIGAGGTAVSGPANTVGATGGVEQQSIASANLPAHTHGAGTLVNGNDSPDHSHTDSGHVHPMFTQGGPSGGSGSGSQWVANTISSNTNGPVGTGSGAAAIGGASARHSHTISGATDNGPGSATAMTVMQPSAVVTKIIKT